MKKQVLWIGILCFLVSTAIAQNFGDQATAGFDNSRTYANESTPSLKPPLRLFNTVELPGADNANSLAVFDNRYLVGKADGPISYSLYDAAGVLAWTANFQGNSAALDYIPAQAQGIAILGGDNTSSIRAVSLVDGTTLWAASVGTTAGRYPIVTDNLAIYAGASRVAAVDATTGQVFWQVNATTASAPISVFGNRVYFLQGDRTLRALDLRTGADVWSTGNIAADGGALIPTEQHIFGAVPEGAVVGSLSAITGQQDWPAPVFLGGTFSASNPLAFAGGRLIAFRSDNGEGDASVTALNPRTGELLWEISEPGEGLQFGFIANKTIYYYHEETGRIRARDLATGTLLWSIARAGVDSLTVSADSLIALVDGSVEIYRYSPESYLAQMASGSGQATLLALSNPNSDDVSATVEFFDDSGASITVPVEGIGSVDHISLTIPAGISRRIQIGQVASGFVVGWVRVTATQDVRATSVYQVRNEDTIIHEAGVGDSSASGSGNVLVTADNNGFNTGIALANPTDGHATVKLTLLDWQGEVVDDVTFDLEPLGHTAEFLTEWFPMDLNMIGGFEGTIRFESDVPVTVTALRTKDLLQISSYPVGQAVK